MNQRKSYENQIKPFNFLLSCHIKQLGHPIGSNPEHFHLIAPYESDPGKWTTIKWVDQYTGKPYNITTTEHHGDRHTARVKTYGDVLIDYEFHPETKNADANGNPSGKQTIGLLQRRHIQIDEIKYIGKESNLIEDVESGLVHSETNIYTEYVDPKRDEWETKIRPALQKTSLTILRKESRMSRRTLIYARTGKRRPHRKHQELLASVLRRLNLI